MKALVITIAGVLLSLVASLVNNTWLAVLATLVALMGAYAQYRDTVPYELVFSATSWQKVNDGFNLVIPQKQHSKSNPTATVFEGKAPNFAEVGVGIKVDSDRAIVIEAALTFEGKVIVK